jgi:hypothetical protein
MTNFDTLTKSHARIIEPLDTARNLDRGANAGEVMTHAINIEPLTTARKLDRGSSPLIAAADWDRGTEWTVVYSDGEVRYLTRGEFLIGVWIRPNLHLMYVETAHLKKSNEKSLSQVYSGDELNTMAFTSQIRLSEGRFAPKVSERTGFGEYGKGEKKLKWESDKSKDAHALVQYMVDNPLTANSAKHFVRPADERDYSEENALVEAINLMLNKQRQQKYKTPQFDRCMALLKESDLPQITKDILKIRQVHVGKPREAQSVATVSKPVVMACYACIFDEDGQPRRRAANNEIVGVDYLMDKIIEMSGQRAGGILRSTLVRSGCNVKHVEALADEHKVKYLSLGSNKGFRVLLKYFKSHARLIEPLDTARNKDRGTSAGPTHANPIEPLTTARNLDRG